MQAFLDMKSKRDLDIDDGVRVHGLERSKLGLITQFMSPPTIRIVIQRGKTFKNLIDKMRIIKIGGIYVN